MSGRKGDYPPTREKDNYPDETESLEEGSASGGKIALFALTIAVVLGAIFHGLDKQEQPSSSLAGKYGECTVSNEMGSPRFLFRGYPSTAAFHAAVDEFAKKNPDYPIVGIVAYKK